MVTALYGYGPIKLWPYMVMALYSYGPMKLWPDVGMARRVQQRLVVRLEVRAILLVYELEDACELPVAVDARAAQQRLRAVPRLT